MRQASLHFKLSEKMGILRNKDKNYEGKIRESFARMKEDILYLQHELIILRQELAETNKLLHRILASKIIEKHSSKQSNTYPTHIQHMKRAPTHILPNQALSRQYFHSSIGNEGVPTDSQQTSNRQNRQEIIKKVAPRSPRLSPPSQKPLALPPNFSNISNISSIVSSMKQELQDKFKKLTRQEFLVFSILYTLEQELGQVTYRDIAFKAGLAESSVRDYISRLEHKGIPIVKERINNKIVLLKISPELRNIATLDALSKLVRF